MTDARPVRDIASLGRWGIRLLVFQAVLSAIALATALAHGPGFTEDSVAYGFVALLQLLLFLVAGIVVLRWIWVATANAQAFGAEGLPCGPWLAVGSYFIPLVNLAMPFQAMRAVWKASIEPRDWEVAAAPALLGWWWFFWLTGNIAGIAAFRLSDTGRYGDIGSVPGTLTMSSDALTIFASLLLAIIVRRLTAMQQARASFA